MKHLWMDYDIKLLVRTAGIWAHSCLTHTYLTDSSSGWWPQIHDLQPHQTRKSPVERDQRNYVVVEEKIGEL